MPKFQYQAMNQDDFVIFTSGPGELPEHSHYQALFGFTIPMSKLYNTEQVIT